MITRIVRTPILGVTGKLEDLASIAPAGVDRVPILLLTWRGSEGIPGPTPVLTDPGLTS